MFEPFDDYVWNLSTNIALNTGGQISEVDEVVRRLRAVDQSDEDTSTEEFFRAWTELADRLVDVADADLVAGHDRSAGARYQRAAVYYLTAERMQNRSYVARRDAYAKMLAAFEKGTRLSQENCVRLEVPYGSGSIPSLFVAAVGDDGPAPCMVFCNGLDSTKEMILGSGAPGELARRGVSTLVVDQPGTGEALRLRDMPGVVESERWAGACLDELATRTDVDPGRIGVMGWSLGGYFAPRAAAFERRFSLCVSWGANYDWGATQRRRLRREGDRPVPHYWDHVQWVFGQDSLEDFMEFSSRMTLAGVVEKITVPFLVTHGANDRQIPASDAVAQYEAAINSKRRRLSWFTEREGGTEHVSADNMGVAGAFIADWVADTI